MLYFLRNGLSFLKKSQEQSVWFWMHSKCLLLKSKEKLPRAWELQAGPRLSPGCLICPHCFSVFVAAACSQLFSLGKHKDCMYQHTQNRFGSGEQAPINQVPRDRCLMPELKGGSAHFNLFQKAMLEAQIWLRSNLCMCCAQHQIAISNVLGKHRIRKKSY